MMMSQMENLRKSLDSQAPKPQIIAVGSGKGGVGKSTLSLATSILLAQSGQKVLLIDADPGLADLNILLGLNPPFHWGDFVRGEKQFHEIVMPDVFGMDFVHGFSGFKDGAALSAENAHKLLDALQEQKKHYDYIVLDVGAGLAPANLVYLTRSDFVMLVLNSELTSLADAYGTLKTMRLQNAAQNFGITVNQADNLAQARLVFDNLSKISHRFLGVEFPFLGWIPKDNTVPLALSKQQPLPFSYPQSPFVLALRNVIESLNNYLHKKEPKNG